MPREKVDLVSTFLVAGGYDTFEVRDLNDLVENADRMFCDYIEDDLLLRRDDPPQILFYLERDDTARGEEISGFLLGVAKELGWDDVICELRLVENSDWDTAWKKYFYPFPVGERLFVCPPWEEVSPEVIGSRKVISIDPAAAFGSGTHATTRLCLEALERSVQGGERVLDMGCGSGILAIAARLLGAGHVTAVDIDEAAVRTTEENFLKNTADATDLTLICGNALSDDGTREKMGVGYQVICANIVAGIIKEMAPILCEALLSDGVLLASGILKEREAEVTQALTAAGLIHLDTQYSEEWVCMKWTRK